MNTSLFLLSPRFWRWTIQCARRKFPSDVIGLAGYSSSSDQADFEYFVFLRSFIPAHGDMSSVGIFVAGIPQMNLNIKVFVIGPPYSGNDGKSKQFVCVYVPIFISISSVGKINYPTVKQGKPSIYFEAYSPLFKIL